MTKMKHAWFPVTLSFVLTHSSDRFNSVWRVRKHEAQSNRESCVFHFSHFKLYFALHSCLLSTFQKHLLLFPTINANIITSRQTMWKHRKGYNVLFHLKRRKPLNLDYNFYYIRYLAWNNCFLSAKFENEKLNFCLAKTESPSDLVSEAEILKI